MSQKYLFDIESFSELTGKANIYVTNVDHRFLYMNETCQLFIVNLMGVKDPIGKTVQETFSPNQQAINTIITENESVLKTRSAETFYNVVDLSSNNKIEFLTMKMPIYEKDKLAGVFGISYYIEQISSLPAYQLGLTDREIDCVKLLLENKPYKEIAKQLKLSPRTVESYLQNAKDKLNCDSNLDLLSKARQTNIKTKLTESVKISSTTLDYTTLPEAIKKIKCRNTRD